METYDKYRDRGVVFVGLTAAPGLIAEHFVRDQAMPWPNGFGAGQTVGSLVNGIGAPTLFVIGRDGRVCWNDACARSQHKTDGLVGELENAIEAALALGEGTAAP